MYGAVGGDICGRVSMAVDFYFSFYSRSAHEKEPLSRFAINVVARGRQWWPLRQMGTGTRSSTSSTTAAAVAPA